MVVLTDISLHVRYPEVGGRYPQSKPLLLFHEDRDLEPIVLKKVDSHFSSLQMEQYTVTSAENERGKKITRTCMLEYSVCVYQFSTIISTVRYSQKFLSGEKILLFMPPVRTDDFFFILLIYFPMLTITYVHRAYGSLHNMDTIFHCNARIARLGKCLCPTKNFGCMVQ